MTIIGENKLKITLINVLSKYRPDNDSNYYYLLLKILFRKYFSKTLILIKFIISKIY